MYSPFLWWITKMQSCLIIKRRWRRWPSNACQIYSQGLKFGKHIHQKLTMSHLKVSNIRRIIESSDVKGGGVAAAVGSMYASAVGSLEEEGGEGATPKENSTLGHLKLALIWAALCLRNVASIRAIIWTDLDAGNKSNPRCNKILCMKTGKSNPCPVELLPWTSTKDRIKWWGKLIGAFVIRAYKNAHLSKGMVCKWDMGQIEWHEIQKKEIMNLGQLVRGDPRIRTLLDRRPSKIWHNVIQRRGLIIGINRLSYQRYS